MIVKSDIQVSVVAQLGLLACVFILIEQFDGLTWRDLQSVTDLVVKLVELNITGNSNGDKIIAEVNLDFHGSCCLAAAGGGCRC